MSKTETSFVRGNAFGVVTITTAVLLLLAVTMPHVTHAQSLFGYGGGGRFPLPIPPRVSQLLLNLPTFLNNLFSNIFGNRFGGGFPF
jgi:hypothetical protein